MGRSIFWGDFSTLPDHYPLFIRMIPCSFLFHYTALPMASASASSWWPRMEPSVVVLPAKMTPRSYALLKTLSHPSTPPMACWGVSLSPDSAVVRRYTEIVVRRVEAVRPIQKGFHLAAHFVVIDGCSKDHHVGPADFLYHLFRIIMVHHAGFRFQAVPAADAEADLLPRHGHKFHFISRFLRPFGKGPGQDIGISVKPWAGADNR